MKNKKATALILQLEKTWSQGSSHPLMPLETENAAAVFSHFLRHYRGRNDLALATQITYEDAASDSFISKIETVRSLIFSDQTEKAQMILGSLIQQTPSEKAECELELTRILLHQNRFLEALALIDSIVRSSNLIGPTLLTCYQLRGHAYFIAKDLDLAEVNLIKAVQLSEVFPEQRSTYSALAFLILVLSQKQQFTLAEKYIKTLRQKIERIESVELKTDRLIMLTRSEFHYYRTRKFYQESLNALSESTEIARWLQEESVFQRCQLERPDLIDEALSTGFSFEKESSICQFETWTYLPRHELILEFHPKQVRSVQNSELVKKVLRCLLNGPMFENEFFEKVWDIPYNPERHSQHLRSSISNLRKIIPKNGLIHKDRTIRLK